MRSLLVPQALCICLFVLTLVQSQKFTFITTQTDDLNNNYVWLRELQLISVDPDTGVYLACAIDSGLYAGQKTITYNSKTGVTSSVRETSQDPLYPPTWTAVQHWVIKGAPYSPCSYGAISAVQSGQVMYAVLGMGYGVTPQYMTSPIPVLPGQDNMGASVVWSDQSLVTITWGGGSNLTSYLNNTLSMKGPFSYLASDDTTKAANKIVRYVNNNRFWVTLPITAGYTLIYKCNSTSCEQTARIEGTADFWMDANENDEWWGCGKALTNYFCTSSADPTNLSYLPSTYADTDYPPGGTYHSTCLMNTTMVMFLSSKSISVTDYVLLALDTQDNFTVMTEKRQTADTDWFSISCLKDTVVAPHWAGYDFWNYQQPPPKQVITTPVTSNTPTSAPVSSVSPVGSPVADVAPTAPPTSPQEFITPAGPDVALTAGLTTSLVGAAVGVGIFLLVFFLRKKQTNTKPEDPEDNKTTYEALPPPRNSMTGYAVVSASPDDERSAKMLIPYKELQFDKEIGAGSFGKVFIGQWRGANVAIKSSTRSSDTEAFLAEAKLTVNLPPHPNVVLTYGVSVDSDVPYIVLEYCDGGSLDSLVFKQTIKQSQQRELVKGLAFGLYHLHSHYIVHRDLAVRNVLLHQGKPKISDFGMSRVLKEEAQGQTNSNVGPIRWMAPESIKSMTYSPKSDVWTFGIVSKFVRTSNEDEHVTLTILSVSEIVNGHEPHFGTNQIEVACQIRDEGLTPHIPDDCDPVLKELMQMCWKMDPNQRPSMAEICEVVSKKL